MTTTLPRIACVATLIPFASFAYGASAKQPDIKANPNPRVRYEITATVIDAPGEFDRIEGHVDYKVTNTKCVPLTPGSGATVEPKKSLRVTYERVSENAYRGVIYIDQLHDEDYFGLGVCHWSVVGVTADLQHQKVKFSPAIYLKDIVSGVVVVRYFSMLSYEKPEDARLDIGLPSRSGFDDPNSTFSISLKAVEKFNETRVDH